MKLRLKACSRLPFIESSRNTAVFHLTIRTEFSEVQIHVLRRDADHRKR
jgi:hypothetical protein